MDKVASSRATAAAAVPYTDYGLRVGSDDKWQLIEPLPTDKRALEVELHRVNATLEGLADDSARDFVKGAAILETRRREREVQARACFDRMEASAVMLFDHECDQARVRAGARCEQLKLDMAATIQREIRRLRHARDGVAVMDRRRLTRHSGSSSTNNHSNTNGNGGDGGGQGGYDGSGGGGDGASTYGGYVTEKKRMEVLLSATPIFRLLDKTIPSEEVSTDLERIQESMPSFLQAEDTGTMNGGREDESIDEEEAQKLQDLRLQEAARTTSSGGSSCKRRRLV